ncbi:MAG: efflux RND transporter permease subunit [Halieaceae bacterium]|nr:efflux RND transporter permease subunit [Halieaceae bacterium]
MHHLIGWFVDRPLVINMIMGMVFTLGYLTIADMRYEYNPHVDMGVINITTVKAGAGPEQVELAITLPLEEELLEVEGIKKLYSNSMESLSVITLNLDLDAAAKQDIMRDIQQAVDRAVARLPSDLLEKPRVEELSTLMTPIMEVHVTGDVPEALLRDVARNVSDGLREVEGIASVEKLGYRRPEVRIMLQPEKMARLGISHGEIIEAIQTRNRRESGGAIDSFVAEKKIIAVGQFQNPREVEAVVIRSGAPGNAVLLRDIATIVEDYEDWEVQSRVNGRMGVTLQARKKALADEVHTAANVRAFVERVAVPPGVELVTTADISRLTHNMLDVLGGNATLGLVSVLLLLCYFLELRFAVWVAVGIPFAVCLSFLGLAAIDVTINAMSLTAIVLLMGILVDDAVVVSENVQRLRQEGVDVRTASVEGSAQVAQPVIFSALTTMLAFAPLMFIDGPSGDFMVPFPLAVIVLLLASLLESLCLLPGHLYHIPHRATKERARTFLRLRDWYSGKIGSVLERRYLSLCAFVVVFVVVMTIGYQNISFSMYPDVDIDTVQVKVEMPVGSRFEETVAAVAELESEVRDKVAAIDLLAITSQIGHHDTDFYGTTEGRNHAWALISIELEPLGRRSGDTNTRELVEDLREWAAAKTGFHSLVVQALSDVPVLGKPVQVEIISTGDERYLAAEELLQYLSGHAGISSSWSSVNAGKDVVELDVNHMLLAARGLTMEQLLQAMRIAVDGLLVDEVQTLDERVRYRLQFPLSEAGKLNTLENLALVNRAGEAVYLNSVARFSVRPGEADIKHYFGKRTVTVYGEIDNTNTSVQAMNDDVAAWIASQNWSRAYPQLRVHMGGEMEEQGEALRELGVAAIICVLSIFAALVILFNSTSQPLLVMLCIPFGLVGVVICYLVQGLSVGMMAITGVIGLIGVLVNDSLVLLHTLNATRKSRGGPLLVSEVVSVATRRFRPIFITSVTTAVGLLPTAYGILGENSYISPMVMSMAWGVVFGGLVSLVLLPILYMVEQDIRLKLNRQPATGSI